MNLHDRSFYVSTVSACSENEGVSEGWHLSLPLSVYSHKAQLVPDLVNENVDS